MKRITIIFRKSPIGTSSAREGLDFALLSASFEQEVSLVFTMEAVLHLLPSQNPELSGSKDYIAALKALSLYDIDTVLVCQASLKALGLRNEQLAIHATAASFDDIKALINHADEIMVY
ncbi:DsrE-like protein [Shewanella denitrificans OS217]|jgi:tRNA 2-thiouridine synthesizing protein C|uniref:DsrE-like protein n=1 Tax=Shewanella denitrificans (strain OS217 / ATCC BAA-1090 / DSM 15013) TaxID=318161 RepID=Q12N85_SHEDO|nr:sulfurtransferase complex subunit TusC [Shewanella denitrificans]ABE55091.1 DsrE-like protein [Shewanella denitrificans OS217]